MDSKVIFALVAVVAVSGFVFTVYNVPWPTSSGNLPNRLSFNRGPVAGPVVNADSHGHEQAKPKQKADLVPVDLHVMSICPDAVFCENTFSTVLEQVGEIINLSTQYIAEVSGTGFTCKHGAEECQGNQVQLCTRQLYPDPAQWFNFILCQDENYRLIPSNTQLCANRLGLNATNINRCVEVNGADLHRTSISLTTSRSITKSCTVVINGTKACIRDGGTWYDCPNGSNVSDFVRQICDAYTGADKPAGCSKA